MHSWVFGSPAILAIVAAASTALADPLSQPAAESPPVASFYPPAALAAGVGGEATLLCGRTEHGALVDCKLGEEQPVGRGFGAAALALAAQSVDGCGRPISPKVREASPIRFTFQAAPAAIEPDPRQPGWILTGADWRKVPNVERFLRYYPEQAARKHIGGEAVIQCLTGADGDLTACQAIAESPHDYGFAEAALGLSTMFAVGPTTCGGHFAGATVVIPIRYQPS